MLVVQVLEHFTFTGAPNDFRLQEGDHCAFTRLSGSKLQVPAATLPSALYARTYDPTEFPEDEGPRYGGGDILGTFVRPLENGTPTALQWSFTEAPMATLDEAFMERAVP